MREEVVVLSPGDPLAGRECIVCTTPVEAGEKAVVCPRCKSLHHLDCWIQRGGCAKRGCRQVARRDLLPSKEEKPIKPSRTPPWVIAAVLLLLVAVGVGIYQNAQNAAERRAKTVSVMVPATEDEMPWLEAIETYNATNENAMTAELMLTPVGPTSPYDQKLVVLMAARDAPEIVVLAMDRYAQYAERGALLPLDQEFRELAASGVDAIRGRLEDVEIDGVVYGIPHPTAEAVIAVPAVSRHPDEGRKLLKIVVRRLAGLEETTDG